MQISCRLCVIICLTLTLVTVRAESRPDFEFVNQPVADILAALSLWQGRSIVADSTVTGNSSFRFSGLDFDSALAVWLDMEGLYKREVSGALILSRISISRSENGRFDIRSSGASLAQLLSRLSGETGVPIRYDILPEQSIHVFIRDTGCKEALQLLMRPWPEWQTVEESGALIVSRFDSPPASRTLYGNTSTNWGSSGELDGRADTSPLIIKKDGLYQSSFKSARLQRVLSELFELSENQFSLLMSADTALGSISFSEKNFEEALALVLVQANAHYLLVDGVFHIIPSGGSGNTERLRDGEQTWTEVTLRYMNSASARSLLAERFPGIQTVSTDGSSVLLFRCPEKITASVLELLQRFDRTPYSRLVRLRYIRTSDLAENLPPGFLREEIRNTGSNNAFYFTGTAERLEILREALEELDRPRARIRYDLLIIQYQDTESLSRETKIQIHPLRLGDSSGLTAALDGLIGLRFDVLSLFGHHFSAQLHTAIKSNRAGVFADTTLYGLSGEELRFQNTATFRYREMAIDPDSGKPLVSGVTREILSGVVVRIQGWVSGDGMITMEVEASVSKRGADVSGTSGNPPPTSEKMIATRIRAGSGEPVVLSGLRWSDSDLAEQRTPFISRIPIVGIPFRNFTRSKETGEMIIYLVPHLAAEPADSTDEWERALELLDRCTEGVLP